MKIISLDNLSSQKSPYDKTSVGYIADTSYREDANTKSQSKKVEEKIESSNLNKSKDRRWEEFGNITTPKSYVDAIKKSIHNASSVEIWAMSWQISP